MIVKAKNANCGVCPLQANSNNIVKSTGPRDAKLIVVGDLPRFMDGPTGSPFTGDPGNLLKALLRGAGIDPIREVFYTNAVLCWDRHRKADQAEAARACKGRLKYVLDLFDQKVPVLALGELAQEMLGLTTPEQWGIEGLTGKRAIGGIHPAQVVRRPTEMATLERLIAKAAGKQRPQSIRLQPPLINPPHLRWPLPNGHYGRICIDIETTGVKWYNPDHQIFMVGMAFEIGLPPIIFKGEVLDNPEWQWWLRAFCKAQATQIGGHNFKFDWLFLHRQFDIELVDYGWDTIAMVNVINEHWHKGLKELATYYFDVDDYGHRLVHQHLAKYRLVKDRTFDKAPEQNLDEYLLCDVVYNLHLSYILERELQLLCKWEMPYLEHEMPQANLLTQVEARGMLIDQEAVAALQAEMDRHLLAMTMEIRRLSGGHITKPGSSHQIARYLYNELKLKVTSKTATGRPSTNEDTLRKIEGVPVVEALLTYSRVKKLKSSYLDNLGRFMDPDGVVHPQYKFWNVVTHRLSAADPAVQTIPHKDEVKDRTPEGLVEAVQDFFPSYQPDGDYGSRIKQCYVARPGHVLLTTDGAGWELFTAAMQSGDAFLSNAMVNNLDPHGQVCDMFYGAGQWNKADRVKEKNVFFGWVYGGHPPTLSRESGLPIQQVQQVVDFFVNNLTGLAEWRLKVIEQARTTGKLGVPYFNYTVHFDLITDKVIGELPRQAPNYLNQGLGSMIMSAAAIKAQPRLKEIGAYVVALVHDDFTAEVPEQRLDEALRIMAEEVQRASGRVAQELGSSLVGKVEPKVGKNWGAQTDYITTT